MIKKTLFLAAVLFCVFTDLFAQSGFNPYDDKSDPWFGLAAAPGVVTARSNDETTTFTGMAVEVSYGNVFTRNTSLILDFGIYFKSENDFRITRTFLKGGVQHTILDLGKKGVDDILVFGRLTAGIANETHKFDFGMISDKEKFMAFCFALGLGFDYWFSKHLSLQISPEYVHTSFHDDNQWSLRVGAGVKYRLWP